MSINSLFVALILSLNLFSNGSYSSNERTKVIALMNIANDESLSEIFPEDKFDLYVVHKGEENLGNFCSYSEYENTWEGIKACGEMLLNTAGRIDYIVNAETEEFVEYAARLREVLGVASGMREEVAQNFYDKLAMKKAISAAGITTAAFAPFAQREEFISEVGYPVVVKERKGDGSRGVFIVENENMLGEVMERLRENGHEDSEYLIEKFIVGPIYAYDAYVVDGKTYYGLPVVYHRTVHEFYAGGKPTGASILSDHEFKNRLAVFAQESVSALGMQYGVIHLEIIRDASSDEIFFMEIAARQSGTTIHKQLKEAGHIDLNVQRMLLESGQDAAQTQSLGRRIFGTYRIPTKNYRRVKSISIENRDQLKFVTFEHDIGEQKRFFRGDEPRIDFSCECSNEELMEQFSFLDENLKIRDTDIDEVLDKYMKPRHYDIFSELNMFVEEYENLIWLHQLDVNYRLTDMCVAL